MYIWQIFRKVATVSYVRVKVQNKLSAIRVYRSLSI